MLVRRHVLLLSLLSTLAVGHLTLLMEPRIARRAYESFKHDFDMNVDFQLRMLGLKENTSSK
jgi:hypothetical protein